MNPEINIRISFSGGQSNVEVQKQIGEGQEAVQVQEQLDSPTVPEVFDNSSSFLESAQSESSLMEVYLAPQESEFNDDAENADIPEDEFEISDSSFDVSAPSDEDDILNVSAPESNGNGLEVSAPADVENDFSANDDFIPTIPDEDMDEAIEMHILSQLAELEASFEKETTDLEVPEPDIENDDAFSDDQIPPLPQA